MIPRKELNIYPRNKKNVRAIVEYFFNKTNLPDGGDLFQLFKDNNLSINQIEFVTRLVAQEHEFFKKQRGLGRSKYEYIRWAIYVLFDLSQKDKNENAQEFYELIDRKEAATILS